MEEMDFISDNNTDSKTLYDNGDTAQALTATEQKEMELFLKLHIANHRPG